MKGWTRDRHIIVVAACAALALLAGCVSLSAVYNEAKGGGSEVATGPILRVQSAMSTTKGRGVPELRQFAGTPVRLVVADCPQQVSVSENNVFLGTTKTVASIPFETVLRRQFSFVLGASFCLVDDALASDLTVVVRPRQIAVKKTDDKTARCFGEFEIQISRGESGPPLFEENFRGDQVSGWDGVEVPESVWNCVNQVGGNFLSRLAQKPEVFAALEVGTPSGAKCRRPEFLSFELKPVGDERVFAGACRLSCGGWDSARAANWLREQLECRCCEQLDVEESRVRVVYEENQFDPSSRVWSVRFKTFSRIPWFLNYDPASRKGVCAVDLELAGLTAPEGAEAMKAYVMKEMNRRGIVVSDDRDSGSAEVKFGDFQTDDRYGNIQCSFVLVN